MKNFLTLIALLLSFLASQAETVVVDGIKYELSGSNASVVFFDRSDSYANNGQYYKGIINIPNSITYNDTQYNVVKITEYAFINCGELTSITIPATVTTVGDQAFTGCNSLRKVIISDSNTSIQFNGKRISEYSDTYEGTFQCLPLEEVYIGRNIVLPESNIYRYNSVFKDCKNLTKVTFSDNVNFVGRLFEGCSNIRSLSWTNSVTEIDGYAFSGCSSLVSIGDMSNVTSIGFNAFSGYSSLVSIGDIPNITTIKSGTFRECTSLLSIKLDNVTSIGEGAFSGCASLTSVGNLLNVTSLGAAAFSGCSSLSSVDIPGVSSIEHSTFNGCKSLIHFTIYPNVKSVGGSAFYDCTGLKKLIILDSYDYLTMGTSSYVNDYGFVTTSLFSKSPLEEIYIGREISNSDDNYPPFANSNNLEKVTIGENVAKLGKGLFKNCPNVMTINIPASVKEIKDEAFSGDWAILKFNDSIPATIGSAFSVYNLLVVPDSVYTDYYNAWTNYQGQILSDAYPLEYDIEVEAKQSDSDVLSKVLDGAPSSKALNVVSLKVKGGINSYDIMVMRNKLLNLQNLDLSEADIVSNSYEYYTGYHSTDSLIGPYSFYKLNKLKSVKLPNSVKTISEASFAYCPHLESLELGEGNIYIKDGSSYMDYASFNNIYLGAFSCCNLKEVKFNKRLKYVGAYAFNGNSQLKEIDVADSLETISNYAFSGCSSLATVKMGPELRTIGQYAFQNCSKLTDVTFSPALTSIGTYGFSGCSSIETIMLPTSLKSIGAYAFSGCGKLKNVRIPASIEVIGDYAFNTSSITDIYTWTIEPTNINQNTFHSDLFTKTTLHVPETSSSLYYWDTQWSQFLNATEFNEPYEYFYLKNKDLVEDPQTPRIEGEDGNNPDADINAGSGLIVNGDESQNLGCTIIYVDSSSNGGTIIGDESSTAPSGANVNIDKLAIRIQITANKWYFFAFPFEIALDDVHFDGQYVWRYYDGEYRAVHGNGAWKTMEEPRLQPGKGYIFQGSKSGTLELLVGRAYIGGDDKLIELANHASSNLQNASWNLVGNPFTSYYQISDMDYSSPITIWNGTTYTAYNPNDDDVTLYPFQAFFVQKPEANTNLGFLAQHRITKNQRDDKATMSRAQKRRMAKSRSAVDREIVNIEVSDGETTDMTRVVFNEESLGSYELACDASKFISDGAPQIYTMDATNVQYSINERPVADGIVRLGFTATHSGSFTLSASRLDCPMWLKDVATGMVCDLSTDDYEFTSDAGTFDDRFLLINDYVDPSGIADIEGENDADAIYYGVNGVRLNNASSNGVTVVKKGGKVEKVFNK